MMNSPIQVLKPKYRKDEIFKHLSECIDANWTGLGFKTVEFEERWKEHTEFENAHFINSNTSGLHLALNILKEANKWKDGDEIITTPLTFVSTNHSILYENLKPVFADVDETLCLDPISVERNITKRTRAVLFVGIGGSTGQYNKILHICRKYKLKLILDAAHMAGTKVDKHELGTILYDSQVGWDADVSIFSFQAVKNLPTADSGMICFKNEDYDILARKMSWLGIDKDTYSRSTSRGTYKWDYDVPAVGFKYHGNSIMASFGLVGLEYLDVDNQYRRELAEFYDELLKEEYKVVTVPQNTPLSARHLYQIKVDKRDEIMTNLNNYNIFPGVHYKDNTLYSMFSYGYGKCPNAHAASEQLITLPLHCHMDKKDCEYVVDCLSKSLKKW